MIGSWWRPFSIASWWALTLKLQILHEVSKRCVMVSFFGYICPRWWTYVSSILQQSNNITFKSLIVIIQCHKELVGISGFVSLFIWHSDTENTRLSTDACASHCVNLVIVGADNGLSPVWHQAIIWTNAGSSAIGLLRTNSVKFASKYKYFPLRTFAWKYRLQSGGHFLSLNAIALIRAGVVIKRASFTWWRHHETFSALLALCAGDSPVTDEFPAQRPMTQSFDGFFYLRLNKQLSK